MNEVLNMIENEIMAKRIKIDILVKYFWDKLL